MKNQATNKSILKSPMILAVIALILLIGLGAWMAFGRYQITQDKQRFEKTKVTRDQVVAATLQELGISMPNKTDEMCYRSEYGPYTEGSIWCKVTSVTDLLGVTLNRSELLVRVKNVINELGLEPSDRRSADIEFNSAGDIPCTVELTDDVPLRLEVACSDRAKARHYPFTEYARIAGILRI